jgi:parallel beta-helix repeat protein
VDNFRIENNTSIDNLENGIWPTLSANGLVKKNVSYGSQDSAMWVEGSQNVRVIKNELHDSPTGLEITVSKNITAMSNDVHDNTIGVGLYHPSAAGLPPLGGDGDWEIVHNHVHDNNKPNTAPPGSMSAQLPPGGGILVLGADRVHVTANQVDNNDFFGVAVVDWCVAVSGSDFDCTLRPPAVEPAPDDDTFVSNTLATNATNPIPFGGLEFFAADFTYLAVPPSHGNCFAKNDYTTFKGVPPFPLAKTCN